MAAMDEERLRELLQPYLGEMGPAPNLFSSLSTYLDLLLRWNARTNLTAVRKPEEIVTRHFGESLFTGAVLRGMLGPGAALLDFGSGAGFPGIPIQLLQPDLRCCLAESQGKKASFLREVVRMLGLNTEVWATRVEAMPADRKFSCVTLRAVDRMNVAFESATARVAEGGILAVLGTEASDLPAGWRGESIAIPGSRSRVLHLIQGHNP